MTTRSIVRMARRAAGMTLCVGALCLAAWGSQAAGDAPRVALVLSSGDASTPDVGADFDAAVAALGAEGLGYDVLKVRNPTSLNEFWQSKGAFESRLQPGSVAVIYYAGYGVRIGDTDYLLPAGANPASAAEVAGVGYDLDNFIRGARDKGAEVVVLLDACRRRPQWDGLGVQCLGGAGLQRDHVYVLSAKTAPPGADTAASPFTAELTRRLQPGARVRQVALDLRAARSGGVALDLPISSDQDPVLAPAGAAPPRPVKAPEPAPPPKPAPLVTASNAPEAGTLQPPSETPSAASAPDQADIGQLATTLNEAVTLYDNGDVRGARARVAGMRARVDQALQSSPSSGVLQLMSGRLATVEGDYAGAIAAFERARGGEIPTAVLNYYEGTAYLRAENWSEAARLLEQAVGAWDQNSPNYYANNARRSVRLGEAYRHLGRKDEAKKQFLDSKAATPDVDNAAASMQGALLALSENDWQTAAGLAGLAASYREGTPSKAGLAEAYAALGRARFGLRPTDEAQAWMYVDKALAADPNSRDAADFAASLSAHPRLAAPDFKAMRPAIYSFDRNVEDRAQSCYETPEERDAYLENDINRELAALRTFNRAGIDYMDRLFNLDPYYQARGYDYHDAIIAEHSAWKARVEATQSRSNGLIAWFNIAKNVPFCKGSIPGRLARPASYDPNPPVTGSGGGALAANRGGALSAPAPSPPMQTASTARATAPSAGSPPLVQAPQTAAAAPPPKPLPVPAAPPPQPKAASGSLPAAVTQPAAEAPPPAKAPGPTPASGKGGRGELDVPPPSFTSSSSAPSPAPREAAGGATTPVSIPAKAAAAAPPPAKPTAPAPAPKSAVTTAPPAKSSVGDLPPSAAAKQAATPSAPKPQPAPPPLATPAAAAPRPAGGPLTAPPPALPPMVVAAAAPPPAPVEAAPRSGKKGPAPAKAPPKPEPLTTDQILARAELMLAKGELDTAAADYQRIAAAEPGNAAAGAGGLAARGLIRLRDNDVAGAIEDLEASVKRKPMPVALEALGRIYAVNGNKGAAIDAYSQAIALRPDYDQAYYGRAEVVLARSIQLRDYSGLGTAVSDYNRAIALRGSDFAEGYLGLGTAQFYAMDYDGALDSLNKALAARRIYPQALYTRARVQYERGAFHDSLKDLGDLNDQFYPYARACSAGLAYVGVGDEALRAKDEPGAIDAFHNAESQFKLAVQARNGDRLAYNLSLQANNQVLPGIAGKGFRSARLATTARKVRKPGRAAPTATLDFGEACKTS